MLTVFVSIAIGLVIAFIIQLFHSKIHEEEVLLILIFSLFIGVGLSILVIPKQFTYKYELLNLSSINNDSTKVYTVETNNMINTICKSPSNLRLYSFEKENTTIFKTKVKPFVFIKRKVFKESIWYLSESDCIVKTIIFIN